MTPKKEITEADLLKMKLEINDEQQKARHQQNNMIQNALNLADEVKTDTNLLTQSFNIMKDDVKEIKQMLKDWFKEIRETFVTKDEHLAKINELKEENKLTKENIWLVYKAFYWFIWLVFSALIWVLLYKIWIWIK